MQFRLVLNFKNALHFHNIQLASDSLLKYITHILIKVYSILKEKYIYLYNSYFKILNTTFRYNIIKSGSIIIIFFSN